MRGETGETEETHTKTKGREETERQRDKERERHTHRSSAVHLLVERHARAGEENSVCEQGWLLSFNIGNSLISPLGENITIQNHTRT
jgi:hypothetical protein